MAVAVRRQEMRGSRCISYWTSSCLTKAYVLCKLWSALMLADSVASYPQRASRQILQEV